jgi:hypothetical protein
MLHLKHFFKCNARNFTLVKTEAVHAIKTAHCTNATAVVCNSTPVTVVLRKTIKAEIYGKGMEQPSDPNQSHMSCQVNKRCTQKYGHRLSKLVIGTPQEALCVDLLLGGSMC